MKVNKSASLRRLTASAIVALLLNSSDLSGQVSAVQLKAEAQAQAKATSQLSAKVESKVENKASASS